MHYQDLTLPNFDVRPIRRRFAFEWLGCAAAVATLAGLLWWMWWMDRAAVDQRETERLQAQVKVIERAVATQIEAVNEALGGFLTQLDGWVARPHGLADASDYLQALSAAMPDVSSLFFLDANGIGRAFSSGRSEFIGRDFSARPYFKTAQQDAVPGRLYLSEPFQTYTGKYLMNVSRAVVGPDGKFRGIVAAALEPTQFRSLLNATLYASDMWVSIAHSKGLQFMIEPDMPGLPGTQLNAPGSLFSEHMLSGRAETVLKDVTLSSGEHRYAIVRTVRPEQLDINASFVLAVSRDHNEVFKASAALGRNLALLFTVVSLTIAVGLLLNQRVRLDAKRASWQARRVIHERDDILKRFFFLNLDLFAVLDTKGRYQRVNEAWTRLLGHSGQSLIGTSVGALVHRDDRQRMLQCRRRLVEGKPTVGFIARIRHADGRYREVQWRVLTSKTQVFLSGRDVTDDQQAKREIEQLNRQLEAQQLRLQEMAFRDGLTGVFNRRYFDEALQTEWRAAVRDGKSLACLLLDIDHFKLYNDTYGHQEGDDCLTEVSKTLRQLCLRPRDFVARYGGEEFVALLIDTDAAGALHKGQEVVDAIAAMKIRHERSSVGPYLTVSVGVCALVPTADQAPELLVKWADSALYTAKHTGRNRAVLYQDSQDRIPPAD